MDVNMRRFRVAGTHDLDEMNRLVSEMEKVLRDLAENKLSRGQVSVYCASLIEGQRQSLGRTKPDSWAVCPDDEEMPADARVDFIFFPTYIAVSILSRVKQEFSDIAAAIPDYNEGLRKGMIFATHRRLRGHGYDADDGVREALEIFKIGKVPELVQSDPDFCPEMTALLRELLAK
jgi:hypothetical protein